MRANRFIQRVLLMACCLGAWLALLVAASAQDAAPTRHLLYVAVPGVRDYLEYGGHGLLVFDVDDGHKFVKRIATAGTDESGKPLNVKGICASVAKNRIYISTIKQLMCLDVATEKVLWERTYEAGCDRMSITPDGKTIFLPSLEGPLWYVVDADDGKVTAKIVANSAAHNTICGPSGKSAYLAGLKSPLLRVADTASHSIKTVGPFSASVRPFTIDSSEKRCYVNVNELLGFEIGNIETGEKIGQVVVEGFQKGPTKRHGCPSHGIALTPDEKQLWLTDAANSRVHIFELTTMPPKQLESIELRDQPGWITFTIDGKYAYPSTGDVIETKTRKIVARLADEKMRPVQSEKMIELFVAGDRIVKAGDQFGLGRLASGK